MSQKPLQWVPSRFIIKADQAFIEFVNLEGRPLVEPFMRFDLIRLNQRKLVTYDQFKGYCAADRDLSKSVTGMIFHTSRCGSTLSSQMLRHSSDHVVVSEADLFGNFLQYFRGSNEELVESLRGLIALMADALCSIDQRLIIKWSSWNAYLIEAIHCAVPNVPICYQYRAPAEVLVSLLNTPAEWMDIALVVEKQTNSHYFHKGQYDPPYIQLLRLAGGRGLSKAETAARFVGRCCQAVADFQGEILAVSYHSLPDAVLSRIAPHFNMFMTGVEKSRARMESKLDTKSLHTSTKFTPDSLSKRDQVNEEIVDLCSQYIDPYIEQLESKCNPSNN